MKASQFPREYQAYDFDEKKMYTQKELMDLGMTLTPEGLPYFSKEPHFSIVLLWFSGQLDKNRKKIFEGGICKMHMKNEFGSKTLEYGIMRWNVGTKQFILETPSPFGGQTYEVDEVELLGNEFENPELLSLVTYNEPVTTSK